MKYTQTLGEEIANSITHGIGVGLSIAGLSILVVRAALYGDAWQVTSFAIYGTTLVLLYLASTFYHAFQRPRVKKVFHILDHSAIYLLIAGTYTPFALVSLRGPVGWTLFGLMWGLAVTGIVFKAFFVERFGVISTAIYILMGWAIVFAIKPALGAIPAGGLLWLLAGGLSYTCGVVFYAWKKLPFNHTIWHLFVLGGSICHFFWILFISRNFNVD
ncbi:MAG: hemolysin III family protein [Deltaproteobacteria bacterium]|nr:hemolysin III family protein [Deltaproteobacteria bacterium]